MSKQEESKDEFIFRLGGEGLLEIIDRGHGNLKFKALALLAFLALAIIMVVPREGWYLIALQISSLAIVFLIITTILIYKIDCRKK